MKARLREASPGISRAITAVVIILLVVGASLVIVFFYQDLSSFCSPSQGTGGIVRCHLQSTEFGAVTKYALPSPDRDPNAIVVAPDGSVWFGEQGLPGVGHLFPGNGTLVEYTWPGAYGAESGGSGTYKTDIWGIALWNGKVWASDDVGNRLVGLDPSSGSVQSVILPTNDSFPYTLTVGPENSLWFTELTSSRVGRLYPNGTLHEYPSPGELPAQIVFENKTSGYLVTVGDPSKPLGHVYEFNPSGNFSPFVVGGNEVLNSPDSVAVAQDGLGVIQHGPSQIMFYDSFADGWRDYPTSTVSYTNTVLPYFAVGNGSLIWFNEHYGNRIGELNVTAGTLTEYNEADPPPQSVSKIDNTLTIALGKDRLWFTEWTANYVGFVDTTYNPGFSVALAGNSALQVRQGQKVNLTLVVDGQSSKPLSLQFSDSETFGAVPENITVSSEPSSIQSLNGQQDIRVSLAADKGLAVGNYTVALTVTDGLISRTVYVDVEITT
ncbi:MAG: hypothetical protein JRN54_08525 [Nitrososphaerota archaeon]|nr:hypothetical protein [Nitrososphaerota archaeon]